MRETRLESIPGTVPSPLVYPRGCHFSTRCPEVLECCAEEEPPLVQIESDHSFLGFGVQPPNATWGNILADGKGFIFDAPWLFFIPGIAILVVVLAFNLVGEGLREAMNPKLRRR